MITYTKITNDAPSSHIGKWKIHYDDGTDITPLPMGDDDEWPSYPLVVGSEDDARVYSRSWADYLYALAKTKTRR